MKSFYNAPVMDVIKFDLESDILGESPVGGDNETDVGSDFGGMEGPEIFTIRGYGVTGFGWE